MTMIPWAVGAALWLISALVMLACIMRAGECEGGDEISQLDSWDGVSMREGE